MNEIRIWEPRYHDKKVLISIHKAKSDNKIIIEKGHYAGEYYMHGARLVTYPIGSNGAIRCYEVPLTDLEPIKEDKQYE